TVHLFEYRRHSIPCLLSLRCGSHASHEVLEPFHPESCRPFSSADNRELFSAMAVKNYFAIFIPGLSHRCSRKRKIILRLRQTSRIPHVLCVFANRPSDELFS